MVKSYRGLEIPRVEVPQAVHVQDYMATKLVTFHPDQPIFEVMDLLMKKKISGGPVVNESNELVGVISEGDCLKEIVKGKYHNIPIASGNVSDYMAKDVVTIAPDANVFEVANMFLEKRLRRFPVIKNGKLVGQISQKDVMRAFTKLKSSTWK
ncbi:MAG: CBS domain-containing protein [Cyclobacteriaceae bacterium]